MTYIPNRLSNNPLEPLSFSKSFGDGKTTILSSDGSITSIVFKTQAEYDAIVEKSDSTLYIIKNQ